MKQVLSVSLHDFVEDDKIVYIHDHFIQMSITCLHLQIQYSRRIVNHSAVQKDYLYQSNPSIDFGPLLVLHVV